MGRLYLPHELLVAHGIDVRDPTSVLRHPALPRVCDAVVALVERDLARAADAMGKCPRVTARAARVMFGIYRQLLRRLVARGWTQPGKPVRVPKLIKVLIVARYGLL
jgi:phytoene synthase